MNKQLIATMDFYFAALLMSNSFNLINSEKHDKGVIFIFENQNNELYQKLQSEFNERTANVNMSIFVKNVARLRSELDKHKKTIR
jgi:hypothetical protein